MTICSTQNGKAKSASSIRARREPAPLPGRSFLKIKGEEYLKKLAAQEMFLSRDQRQLADSLAKGKIALTIGLTYYTFLPFLKAGLPIKPLPDMKEGTYTQLRQQRSVRGQKLTAPECDQSFHQLAPRQGRPRDLRQSDGTSDAPL